MFIYARLSFHMAIRFNIIDQSKNIHLIGYLIIKPYHPWSNSLYIFGFCIDYKIFTSYTSYRVPGGAGDTDPVQRDDRVWGSATEDCSNYRPSDH